MANCPKCGRHLKLTDWKQHCPDCGANIFVYDLQERLMCEADKAEVENFYFQRKLDRLKAAFVGNKLTIARIFTSLLPVGAIFLPLINANGTGALEGFSGKLSILGLYEQLQSLPGDTLKAVLSSPGKAALITLILCFILSLVGTVVHFALLTLACSPKAKPRGYITDGLLLLCTLLPVILLLTLPEDAVLTGAPGIGAYLYILLQTANVTVDILTLKKGVEIKHKPALVGGIPIEEYFEMQKNGWSLKDIRAEQYRRLQILYDEKERQLQEQEAGKTAKEVGENG